MFGGSFRQSQVEGIDAILNEWEKRGLTDLRWLAYILATCFHETAKTMQPIAEYGKGKNYDYGKKLDIGNGLGKRLPYVGDHLYYGRGHTQNTWLTNYRKLTVAAQAQGHCWNFVDFPELLLQMEPSIWEKYHALITGM